MRSVKARPFSTPSESRFLLRLALPIAALLVFAGFSVLWGTGGHSLYFELLRQFGVLRLPEIQPWYLPFMDAHAVLSAAECQRHGINVYLENPCDVLGRAHVYSPLWLSLVPSFVSTTDTALVGLVLDFLFILSLAVLFRPRSSAELGLFAVAVFSPTVAFAVERANNDLVIFVLAVCGSVLWSRREGCRIAAYPVYLMAGLLKYYPLVLLILLLREAWRRAIMLAMLAGLGILGLIFAYRGELAAAIGNIPKLSPFMDTFSAQNLPHGMLEVLWGPQPLQHELAAFSIWLVLTVATAVIACHRVRLLERCDIDWTGWEARNLVVASLLLTACFFAGQSVGYRGVYLLLALPGWVSLRLLVTDPQVARWLRQMIALTLVIMWLDCVRKAYDRVTDLGSDAFASSAIKVFIWVQLWVGRELIWWWLMAGMLAIVIAALRRMPLTNEIVGSLRSRVPLPVR
jgi:hypothetical protein